MKDLQGRASASVSAAPETARALLADVADYPRWYPDVVRQAEVVEHQRVLPGCAGIGSGSGATVGATAAAGIVQVGGTSSACRDFISVLSMRRDRPTQRAGSGTLLPAGTTMTARIAGGQGLGSPITGPPLWVPGYV